MACFCNIHRAIARLQAVSASHLQLEPVCVGHFRPPLERKIQGFAPFKKSELFIQSSSRSNLLVFATAGQDTATSTLVLQEVDFSWKGSGSQVFLTGDFLGWDKNVSLNKGTDGAFHCKQKLLPGTYKYKYIIDGEWAHSPDSPTVEDGQGGYNNEITVTEGPHASKESLSAETASIKNTAEPAETASIKNTAEPTPKAADVAPEAEKQLIPAKMAEEALDAAAPPTLSKTVAEPLKAAPSPPPKIVKEASKEMAPQKVAERDLKAAAPSVSQMIVEEASKAVEEAPKAVASLQVAEQDSKAAALSIPPKAVEEASKAVTPPKPTKEDVKPAALSAAPKALKSSPKAAASETPRNTVAEAQKAAAPGPSKTAEGAPKAAPATPMTVEAAKAVSSPKAAPAARAAKKVEKPYPQIIIEDVIPKVKAHLQQNEGLSNVEVEFQNNQLEGSFVKNTIFYSFWAFFPDGKLEGARGFSVSSHGAAPSTVEPFLIDEKRITADLIAFWVLKRLASQEIITY